MDILIYVICLAFGVFFTLFGIKNDYLSFVGIVFNVVVTADVFTNGLTEVIGHVDGEEVTRSFGVDTVILIPMFFVILLVLGMLLRWNSRRG